MPELYFYKESDDNVYVVSRQENYSEDMMKSFFLQIYAKCEELTLQSKKKISFKDFEELNLSSDDESMQDLGKRMRKIRLYRNSLAHEVWNKTEFKHELFKELTIIYIRLYRTLFTREYEQSNMIEII